MTAEQNVGGCFEENTGEKKALFLSVMMSGCISVYTVYLYIYI